MKPDSLKDFGGFVGISGLKIGSPLYFSQHSLISLQVWDLPQVSANNQPTALGLVQPKTRFVHATLFPAGPHFGGQSKVELRVPVTSQNRSEKRIRFQWNDSKMLV